MCSFFFFNDSATTHIYTHTHTLSLPYALQSIKADQLPDPTLKVGIDNLPASGEERYSTTSDFRTMRRIGIEQEWVSSDKRAARATRAQRAVEMERDRKSTRLNSSHQCAYRMPSSA